MALAEGYRVAARAALGAAHKAATKVDVDVNCQHQTAMTTSPPATLATTLRIEAVAQRTGLTKRTIRYYEEIGLLSPSGRSEGGFRLFSEADVARLERIVTLRNSAGLSLADVAELLDAESVRERIRERYLAAEDPAQKRAMLAESHEVLARQLALIERKRRTLDELATEYEERLQRIARLDAELAEQAEPQGAQAQ
jgi:DNA-binding transcriptional MerR regulator